MLSWKRISLYRSWTVRSLCAGIAARMFVLETYSGRATASEQIKSLRPSTAVCGSGLEILATHGTAHRLSSTPAQTRKHFANGGLLIAIIGGDGSGKTTAVNELHRKFSEEFDVIKVHMGKPSWSWVSILIRGIVKVGRSMGLYPFIKEGTEPSIDTNSPIFPGYPWLIREVCTARDRYLDYRRARRFATNGGLVICDRFPLPQIKIMDGYQVERVTGAIKPNRLIKLLAALEDRYYQQILSPDVLVVLRVDPAICVERKTDETSNSVRSRSEEIWNIDWCETRAHVIDASRSKSQVVSEVLNLVWSYL